MVNHGFFLNVHKPSYWQNIWAAKINLPPPVFTWQLNGTASVEMMLSGTIMFLPCLHLKRPIHELDILLKDHEIKKTLKRFFNIL
jgi:hypothetical protein